MITFLYRDKKYELKLQLQNKTSNFKKSFMIDYYFCLNYSAFWDTLSAKSKILQFKNYHVFKLPNISSIQLYWTFHRVIKSLNELKNCGFSTSWCSNKCNSLSFLDLSYLINLYSQLLEFNRIYKKLLHASNVMFFNTETVFRDGYLKVRFRKHILSSTEIGFIPLSDKLSILGVRSMILKIAVAELIAETKNWNIFQFVFWYKMNHPLHRNC